MAPRIAIIGGGSFQWVPKLVADLANTPSLHECTVVIHDIDPVPISRMVDWVRHVADQRGIPMTAEGTTDRRAALEGADYVVVTISTGGFALMRHDLEIPARYGIRQSVGDTVGPGGIVRALRNVPVLVDIARDMDELCPDAWLLNLTNPMTVLCRAVSRETTVRTLGLCHEVTLCQYTLSLLLDVDLRELDLEVAGVNHLPVITRFGVGEQDGFALLRELLDDPARADEPTAAALPPNPGRERSSAPGPGTRGELIAQNRVKLELFRRFGVLPAAGDRHLVEFFAGFLTEESDWGARWGVSLTSIEDRELWARWFGTELDAMFAATQVPTKPSGEMVAPVIDALLCDHRRVLPLDIPNTGQCPDLADHLVVESMCVVDGDGVRGRDRVSVPPVLADTLRRVSASQELTVEAALRGDRALVFEAMLLDPLAGRIDFGAVERMTDEMIEATRAWLPQFD